MAVLIEKHGRAGRVPRKPPTASFDRDSSNKFRPIALGGVMFSPDHERRPLYISDLTNNHIWALNRENGKILGQRGQMGQNGGEFFGLHMEAVDSTLKSFKRIIQALEDIEKAKKETSSQSPVQQAVPFQSRSTSVWMFQISPGAVSY